MTQEQWQDYLGKELADQVAAALREHSRDGKIPELAVINNGSYLPKAKFDSVYHENQALKAQLEETNAALIAREELATRNQALEGKLAAQEETYRQELEKLRLEDALSRALERSGARNQRAVRALLDPDNLHMEDGVIQGLDNQLAAVRSEAPYLFITSEIAAPYCPAGGSGRPDTAQMSDNEYYRYIMQRK